MTWLGYVELQFTAAPASNALMSSLAPFAATPTQSNEVLSLGYYGTNVLAEALWIDTFDTETVRMATGALAVTILGANRAQGQRIAIRLTTRSQRYTHEANWYADPDFRCEDLPPAAQTWFTALKAAYATPPTDSNWWNGVQFHGGLYTAARSLWFTAAGALAGFLATGSLEALDIVNSIVERVLFYMMDGDNDGFIELLYEPGPTAPGLIGTDNGMDYNLLAGWLSTAAYVLHLNRDCNSAYATSADALESWMFNHYLPELVAEGQFGPAAPDDQMHCWSRGALWLHFVGKLWGYRNYNTLLTNSYNRVHPALENTFHDRPNGSLVWDHRPAGHGAWGLQPSVYAGDTIISLVILALDGALDYAMLPKLAKSVALNIFAGAGVFSGERDIGGHVILLGETFPAGDTDGFPLVNAVRFRQTGFASLATWDDTSIISNLAQTAQSTTQNEIAQCGWMLFAEANK